MLLLLPILCYILVMLDITTAYTLLYSSDAGYHYCLYFFIQSKTDSSNSVEKLDVFEYAVFESLKKKKKKKKTSFV